MKSYDLIRTLVQTQGNKTTTDDNDERVSTIEIDVNTGNCFKRNIYRVRNEQAKK